ncbi:cilia BBSome complex subunit 10-domain-containing protein [Pavlovales sp. CCMP2436]|nr:cilia BBSome complex subunit 10-domain-containing protein [Pavlovales sp. CCMP2436]
MDPTAPPVLLQEVLPKAGLVYSEKGNLSEVLCKPKIMPIKSVTLEKIEQMEADMAAIFAAVPRTAM